MSLPEHIYLATPAAFVGRNTCYVPTSGFAEAGQKYGDFEGINHHHLFPVCQPEEIDAHAFFYEFVRLL